MRHLLRTLFAAIVLAALVTGVAGLAVKWALGTQAAWPLPPPARAPVGAAAHGRELLPAIELASLVTGAVTFFLALNLIRSTWRRANRDVTALSWAVQAVSRGESAYLPTDDDGPIGGVARAVAQITAAARAKAAALKVEVAQQQHAAEALEKVLAMDPHPLLVTDDRRAVHFVNVAAAALFGLSADELQRRPFAHPLEPGKAVEIEVYRKGEAVSVELQVVKIEWRGQPALLVSLLEVSERKKLLGQLHQAQKMEAIGRMAGGVAHDFNNLVSIINLSRDLLLSDPLAATPRAQQLLNEIGSAGSRAAALIAQLLAFTRKSSGVLMTVDVNAIVHELAPLLQRLMGEDIELSTVCDSAMCLVKSDPSQFEQVLMNLAANARDAMPAGGRLTIETHNLELDQAYVRLHPAVQPGPYVELVVSDTGVGMSDEVKAHIFEPFFTTKPDGQGTGLGLTTVYTIVQQMGGHITFHSEVGHGTAFRIHLPRRTAGVGSTPSEPPRFEISTGDETILLVEDDPSMRQLTRLVLESYGYTVLEAENGVKALEVAKADGRAIDLVVTDVIMPQMGGRSLMEPLRVARPGVRVLYMSGYTDETVARYGGIEASAPFIQKPFTPAGLANKVRAVLDELPLHSANQT